MTITPNTIQRATFTEFLSPFTADWKISRPGEVVPEGRLLTVGQRTGGVWGTPGTIRDLQRLDHACVERGGRRPRVRQVGRSWDEQILLRASYDRWRAAGEPQPGKPGWTNAMSTAYAAPPGTSNHGWGAAVDFDRYSLEFPGTGAATNAALEVFWEIAGEFGFTPVIAAPRINQSESWHFDHLGPLAGVRDLLRAKGVRDGGSWAARAGHALIGTWKDTGATWRYVQARLLLHAAENGAAGAPGFPGVPDGILGRKTLTALAEVGITATASTPWGEVVMALDERQIGTAALAAA